MLTKSVRGLAALLTLSLLGGAWAGGSAAGTTTVPAAVARQTTPAASAALWRLLERFAPGEVLVAQLPPDWSLPLPAGTEVLGATGFPGSWTVYLESAQSAEKLVSFYRQQPGWQEQAPEPGGWNDSGFLSNGPDALWSSQTRVLIRQTPPAVLRVLAVPDVLVTESGTQPGKTNLTLELQNGQDAVTMFTQASEYDSFAGWLPRLHSPSTVQVEGRGASGSSDWFSQEAGLHTRLSVSELEQLYAAQLREQGWTQQARLPGTSAANQSHTLWYHAGEAEAPARLLTLKLSQQEPGSYVARLSLWRP